MSAVVWRIELFGSLRALRAGQVIHTFPPSKTGSLLACLACRANRLHTRQELVERLWPEADSVVGRTRLRQHLTALRRQLEPDDVPHGSVLCTNRDEIGLVSSAFTTDVADFESALRRAANADDPEERRALLVEAMIFYRAELLPGYYEHWVEAERERLKGKAVGALQGLASTFAQAGDLPRALEIAQRLVAVEPLREESHLAFMRLLAATHQPAAAHRQYRTLEHLLKTELDTTPSVETRAFVESLRAAESDPVPSSSVSCALVSPDVPAVAPVEPQTASLPLLAASVPVRTRHRRLPLLAGTGLLFLLVFCLPARYRPEMPRRTQPIAASLPLPKKTAHQMLLGPKAPSRARRTATFLPARKKPARPHPERLAVAPRARTAGSLPAGNAQPSAFHRNFSPAAKKDGSSKALWINRYETKPGDKDSQPTDMVVDKQGNIYVTGFIDTVKTDVDFLTLKYAPNGKLLWEKRYDGTGHDVDRSRSIAVDADGSVYVTGESLGKSGSGPDKLNELDIVTIKYDANGNKVWEDRYDGPGHGRDEPVKVALDGAGHVYVFGSEWEGVPKTGGDGHGFVLIQYDANGKRNWVCPYTDPNGGPALGASMVIDPAGFVYVTGEFGNGIAMLKYDAAGKLRWERIFPMPQNISGGPGPILRDTAGNLYVVCQITDRTQLPPHPNAAFLVLKYNAEGQRLWDKSYWDDTRDTHFTGAYLTGTGGLYLTGTKVRGTPPYEQFVIGIESDGAKKWESPFSGADRGENGGYALTIGSRSLIHMTGVAHFTDSEGTSRPLDTTEITTLTYDATFALLRIRRYAGSELVKSLGGLLIAVDGQDNIIVAGQTFGGRFNDLVVIKYPP